MTIFGLLDDYLIKDYLFSEASIFLGCLKKELERQKTISNVV